MYFSDNILACIDEIFQTACNEGRNVLYEYEVYQILGNIGIQVPRFVFVKSPDEVDEKLLENFGRDIVVKIVSPDIAHKQKLGGVKIIKNREPLFLQWVLTRMREEVLSHFTGNDKPEIKGFLLVEFLNYTQSIGNETLIGCKEDAEFGPVIILSKGGDDAEFFAKYYDPANIFLPPFDYEQSLALVNTLKIKNRFMETGHPEYLENMAQAVSRISWLAYNYSFVSGKKPNFIIKSLDINPLVITKDNRFVAVDGYAEFISASEEDKMVPEVNLSNLEAFFRPKTVAVVGVSADLAKHSMAREIAKLLHDLGRKDLYLINAKGGSLRINEEVYTLYKSLDDVPQPVELVVYAAPASHMVDFIKGMDTGSSKAIILISGIPAEMEYKEFVKQLNAVKPEGLRVIGPNCMGVYFAPDDSDKGVNTLFVSEKRLEIKYSKNSNTALLSQSGALALTSIDRLKNSRIFKAVVSFGNKYDVKITDLVSYFAKDKDIDLISLYIEGLSTGEGRRFFELVQEIDKPVLVYKSGRTEAGAKAAASHTAAMTGNYDVFRAACIQAGVILAEKLEDHYDYLRIFSLLGKKKPGGNRVAGVVNAGFESTVGADELKNLKPAVLAAETVEKLKLINRHGLVDVSSPFLDVTPMADDRMYADCVEAILQDENVDCVFAAIVPHSNTLKTSPETCRDPDSMANLLIDLGRKYDKPMVVSVNAGRYYYDFISVMEEGGLPVYTDIRSAIKSLDRFVSYHIGTV